MDATTHPPSPRSARRPAVALLALLLAATGVLAATGTTPAGAGATPPPQVTGLLWKMSEGAFTSSSLSPAHATAAPTTKSVDGFSFPEVTDVVVAADGSASATFPGSFDLGNTAQGNYRIRVGPITATIDAGRTTGRLTATVAYALFDAGTQQHVWSTPAAVTVADLTFAAGAIVDTGDHISFSVTPDFVLRTDLADNPNGWKQFPQPFLDAIAPAVPSLLGHFRQTGSGSDANKAPAPVTVGFPYTPLPPPVGLTWKMSETAFTSSSLSPAHATAAPTTKTADGFSFPQSSATYDPATGEGQIDLPGSFDLGNTAQGNYRIRVAAPTVLLDGDGTGSVTAEVSYALFDQGTQQHVWTTPVRVTVADLTLPEGTVTVEGSTLRFTVTPDFVLRTDLADNPNGWKQFPQPYLDAIAPAVPSLLGHFRQTGSGSDANKAPAPLSLNVAFEEPTPVDPDATFVQRLYERALVRTASEGDVTFWVGRLDGGTSRTTVATQVAASSEGRAALVRLQYRVVLDRNPSSADRAYWTGRLASGLTPEGLVTMLIASPENVTRAGGTNAGLAADLYDVFLDTTGDAGGLTYWTGRFDATDAGAGRRNVARSFGATPAVATHQVQGALLSACKGTPALTPEQQALLLAQARGAARHDPVRLTGLALATTCAEGDVL